MARGRWVEILIDLGVPSDALDGRRGRPCPRCGGRDRFAPLPDLPDRGAVMCRGCFGPGDDPRPGDGIASIRWWLGCDALAARRWLAGWIGLSPALSAQAIPRPIVRRLSVPEPSGDPRGPWAANADRWFRAMRPAWRRRAAKLLGIPVEPLERLGVGWSPEHRATTWPMRDDAGRVIGIRLRCPETGRKWAVRGSRAGLIFPVDLTDRGVPRLWICEGPTDAAALLSVGLDVIGVPSAGCGGDLLSGLCRRLAVDGIVIVADADGPGRAGAERLADVVLPVVPSVRVMAPGDGAKDPRAWIVGGADRSAFEAAAADAPMRALGIKGVGR